VLFDLGIELLEIAPLRIGTQSKADRGYDLAFDLAPRSTKATTPAITAEHTVDDIVAELLGTFQHHLLANQAVARGWAGPRGGHSAVLVQRASLRRFSARGCADAEDHALQVSEPDGS
jgi:triphosphatase